MVKLTLSGSLPVINSERYPPPRPLSQHQAASASAAAAPVPAPVAPKGEFRKAIAAATAEQQLASNSLSQQTKAEHAELLAEEAANEKPIGRPSKDCYGLTIWL